MAVNGSLYPPGRFLFDSGSNNYGNFVGFNITGNVTITDLGNVIGINVLGSSDPLSEAAVIFDTVAGETNIRSNRANQTPYSDPSGTEGGTDFGSGIDEGVGNISGTCGGNDFQTIGGGGGNFLQTSSFGGTIPGGVRCDVRGNYATAFGYRCFANGEGCVSGGYINVVGRPVSDPTGERKYATGFGANNFAEADYCFTVGSGNTIHIDSTYGGAIGFNNHVGDGTHTATSGMAFGSQCEAMGTSAFAGCSGSQATGARSVAIGAASVAAGDESHAFGSASSTGVNASYGFASGRLASVTAVAGAAFNQSCTVSERYGFAHGLEAVSTQRGQYSHADGKFVTAGDAQWSRYLLKGTSTNGAAQALQDDSGSGFVFENNKAYYIRASIIAQSNGASGPARFVNHITVEAAGGAANITDDTPDTEATNAAGTGWTIVYSVPAGLSFGATFTGAGGANVNAFCTLEVWEVVKAT